MISLRGFEWGVRLGSRLLLCAIFASVARRVFAKYFFVGFMGFGADFMSSRGAFEVSLLPMADIAAVDI